MILSKTAQLGLIVLAFKLLEEWKFRVPRTIAAVAQALGVVVQERIPGR